MPLFHLDLMQGDQPLPKDGEPQEFADLDAARKEAIKGLRDVAADAVRAGKRFSHRIIITGANGERLGEVTGAEAVPQLKSD